jgi:mRNA-degrading endonuclease RelE of RelBE toxin-antitoxin system
MNWDVYFTGKAAKQAKKLNKKVISILDLLVSDLSNNGPAPGKE